MTPGSAANATDPDRSRAGRLPNLARQTQVRLESEGHGHPILPAITALIDRRCALTIKRLSAINAGPGGEPA